MQINKNDINCKENIVYEDKLFRTRDMRNMLRTMFKERYFNRILTRRTEDLLSKVELLD